MTAVLINGTNNEQSRVNGVRNYVKELLPELNVINVFQLPAEDLITANFNSESIKAANQLVDEADVVILLTPVYKAAYTGILKTYLDLLPQKGLENKVVVPIAVGGTQHHLLAIDYALKPVISALGATTILQGIFVLDSTIQREGTDYVIDPVIVERIRKQIQLAVKNI